jgi:hypothetical protein
MYNEFILSNIGEDPIRRSDLRVQTFGPNEAAGPNEAVVGIRNAQIPLILKLRKDRRTKILLLLKLGIKVCRIITESYRHLILYKRQ